MMRKWSSAHGIKLIREEGVTMTGGVPFIVQEIMERSTPSDVVSLKNNYIWRRTVPKRHSRPCPPYPGRLDDSAELRAFRVQQRGLWTRRR